MDPRGRIAVVTGAAGGIGGALVRALVDAGARTVIATDLAPPEVAADRVSARRLDVTDQAATASLVAEIEDSAGPVDMWFANAGLAGSAGLAGGDALDLSDATWDRQWQVNVMAHVYAARALLPGWLARGEGHLVTTASMAGLLTVLGDGVYAATKHGAVGFAEWLAITYGGQGVRVSCVCPGAVDTAMLAAGTGGDARKAAAGIGGGELLSPDGAAARIVEAATADRFLILTHPEMHQLITRKAEDTDRWIRGMQRLWARTQELMQD